ncbi:GntR family transcriptional regulator [Cerasibacillus terrae]|uniref:GntR family transcriptional regulator n=1 Tax=Cerasibacillus terrae TaxID=2498845 RepID=A0A5C8NG70_9BACI|nr:GntR family transcriptional regulator [Cerasibacillus terrae]TXL57815.1 GntR family transcriptional regulator [Cerasibacillus terrae]
MVRYSRRLSASDVAYDFIRKKIIKLEYAPSTHLVEEQLSKEIEVSRTPLRQALYRLELEQLVLKQPNGRIIVTPITPTEAGDVFKVREVLEGLVAKEATEKLSEQDFHKLEEALVLMKMAAEKDRKEDLVKHGAQFHEILQTASANEVANQFLNQLKSRIARYRRISSYANPTYEPDVVVQEHIQIFNLLQKGQKDEVEKAMRAHIRRSLQSTIETLELYVKGVALEKDK